jgi:ethanolamine ammonia-lyase small subunit
MASNRKRLPTPSPVTQDAWHELRGVTQARIALGRAGGSLPTGEWLAFKSAHAAARDAVHNQFDAERLAAEIAPIGVETVIADSAAPDRATYLQRPDLGRRLNDASRQQLQRRTRPDIRN